MALVMRNTLAGGRGAGFATSLGTCSGLVVHATAAALGLSAVLLASSRAFTAVKLIGAAYLVFLGVRTLLHAGRERRSAGAGARATSAWTAFRQGVLTNVLNPKIAVFFLSLLPQFVDAGDGFVGRAFLLAAIFIAIGLVWLTAYTLALDALGGVLARPRVRRTIETVTGGVLVGLGVRLALARR
jgi:threonine/homoserine/homoserine lactone efflux protein